MSKGNGNQKDNGSEFRDGNSSEEAIRIASQTSDGLASAIWTDDLSRAHRLDGQVDSGFVWINCSNYWTSSIPCEGHRQSGMGVDRVCVPFSAKAAITQER